MKLVLNEDEVKQAVRDWLASYQEVYVIKENIKIVCPTQGNDVVIAEIEYKK